MKKILLVNKEESGSKYHRITIPFTLLKQKFPEEYEITFYYEKYLTEEVSKLYDVIVIHWTHLVKCSHLSFWRDKYGFRLIQDVDDYWELPEGHPVKQNMDKSKYQLIDQLILADGVICSTKELEEKILKYNPITFIRKNFLPINNPLFSQFKIHVRDFFKNKKLNVGICGSISHLPDWIELNKELIEIKNDPFLQKHINLVVSGVSTKNEFSKKIWERITNLFTYGIKNKKKLEVIKPKVFASNLPNNYMQNYLPIDILLCPLVNNEYNNCKSNLKILESGLNGSISISNNRMYDSKIDNNFFINSEKNLKSTLIKLIKMWKYSSKNFKELAENMQTNIIKYNCNLENEEINKLNDFLQKI